MTWPPPNPATRVVVPEPMTRTERIANRATHRWRAEGEVDIACRACGCAYSDIAADYECGSVPCG